MKKYAGAMSVVAVAGGVIDQAVKDINHTRCLHRSIQRRPLNGRQQCSRVGRKRSDDLK